MSLLKELYDPRAELSRDTGYSISTHHRGFITAILRSKPEKPERSLIGGSFFNGVAKRRVNNGRTKSVRVEAASSEQQFCMQIMNIGNKSVAVL